MSSAADFEQRVELVLHNVEYILTVAVAHGDTLCIEVEQKSDGARWRGDFTSRYIEDITQKTGSFKKFSIFVRMLRSAVMQESDSVFVDLLTYADLEALKNRKARGQGTAPLRPTSNNKRYLIITYNAEFDRVHYPLPLLFEEHPEPDALKSTIKRLRDEVEELRAQLRVSQHAGGRPPRPTSASGHTADQDELKRLREENERLKAEVRRLAAEAEEPRANGGEHLEASMGPLLEERREMEEELRHCRREKALLASKLEAKEAELARLKPSRGQAEREIELLRRRLETLEEETSNERSAHKRAMARVTRENATLAEEVRKAKEVERKLRVKVRETESEVEVLKRRARLAGRDLPPARSRPPVVNSRGPSPLSSRGPSPRRSSSTGGAGSRGATPPISRGPTPPGSRGPSPSASRHPTPPGSRPGSRPSSAPTSYRRFDPTAYVKEKAARTGAFPAAGAMRRRSSSTSEARSVSPDPVRGPSSGPRYRQATAAAEARHRSPSADSRHSSAGRGNPPEKAGGVGPRGGARGGRTSGAGTPPRLWSEDERGGGAAGRATSPGRALQDVKNKLAKYANGQAALGGGRGAAAGGLQQDQSNERVVLPGPSEVLGKAAVAYDDATAEIADIDSRLHALQNFLRAAKSTGPPPR